MTIRKLSDGRWEVRYDSYNEYTGKRVQGRRRFRTRSEAISFQREQILGNATPSKLQQDFATYAASWLETWRTVRGLAPSSYRAYKYAIAAYSNVIGELKLPKIKARQIEYVESEMLSRNKSAVTVRTYGRIVSAIFDSAVRDGYINANPFKVADKPREEQHEITPPTTKDIKQLLEDMRGKPEYIFFLLAVTTGCRTGELLGLKWDCVDFDEETITIKRTRAYMRNADRLKYCLSYVPYTHSVLRETTKTRQMRTIAVPKSVMQCLRETRNALWVQRIYPDFVCLNERNRPISQCAVWQIAREHGFRTHDLRHAHATLLIDAGVPVVGVSRRLGHSRPSVTVNVYAHALISQDRGAAQAVEKILHDTSDDTTRESDTGRTSQIINRKAR